MSCHFFIVSSLVFIFLIAIFGFGSFFKIDFFSSNFILQCWVDLGLSLIIFFTGSFFSYDSGHEFEKPAWVDIDFFFRSCFYTDFLF